MWRESADSHLRSSEAVIGYGVEAVDGEIGHVEGFVMDDEAWAIRYVEVATRNWWPGQAVLISPDWVERVRWADSKVCVGLSGKPSETARSTPPPRRSLESMRIAFTCTTAVPILAARGRIQVRFFPEWSLSLARASGPPDAQGLRWSSLAPPRFPARRSKM